jgi:hypothetical protein
MQEPPAAGLAAALGRASLAHSSAAPSGSLEPQAGRSPDPLASSPSPAGQAVAAAPGQAAALPQPGSPGAEAAQQPARGKCGALSHELLQRYAQDNTVMISVNDLTTIKKLARHFVRNLRAANISYWLMVRRRAAGPPGSGRPLAGRAPALPARPPAGVHPADQPLPGVPCTAVARPVANARGTVLCRRRWPRTARPPIS